jgi:hypothetical protein
VRRRTTEIYTIDIVRCQVVSAYNAVENVEAIDAIRVVCYDVSTYSVVRRQTGEVDAISIGKELIVHYSHVSMIWLH